VEVIVIARDAEEIMEPLTRPDDKREWHQCFKPVYDRYFGTPNLNDSTACFMWIKAGCADVTVEVLPNERGHRRMPSSNARLCADIAESATDRGTHEPAGSSCGETEATVGPGK
jgi:hypothetical protein